MEQNSSSDLYLDELPVWRIIRIDGQLVSSINSAIGGVQFVLHNCEILHSVWGLYDKNSAS